MQKNRKARVEEQGGMDSGTDKNRIWRDGGGTSGKRAILLDIDGVISDATHRQHYLKDTDSGGESENKKEKDWKGFFTACVNDPPIAHMVKLLEWLDPELCVVALTARPSWVDKETGDWLNKNNVRWDLLVMRNKEEDSLTAKEFKTRAVKGLTKEGFIFEAAFENDPANVEVIGGEGIPCVYVHSGYYEDSYVHYNE